MSAKNLIKSILLPLHRHQKSAPDVFIFTLPRAGSSLLADVLNTDPQAKMASEPLALHKPNVRLLRKYFRETSLAERYVDISEAQYKQLIGFLTALSEGKTRNSYYWGDLLTPHHHFTSTRTIFKIHRLTYYFDDIMHHFSDDNGLYLIRNPMSHSLSRMRKNWSDYIDLFAASEKIGKHLSREARRKIKEVTNEGSSLEKYVLSWCLENYIFIHRYQQGSLPENVFPVFYEELVREPELTLRKICHGVHMEYHDTMLPLLEVPSRGIVHSTKDTKAQIRAGNKEYLVNRWKESADGHSLQKTREILCSLGVTLYLDSF